jgi:hypothetical protein
MLLVGEDIQAAAMSVPLGGNDGLVIKTGYENPAKEIARGTID